ncbi:MAG: nucleotidyltransferase [Eubacteriales bacterium]|nr:nucleotidyltransferase [Eubacteriales bacterium]MDD3199889.1 nucleotidyltransferase [Eubacteriales bacterium]MDD4630281.1 nucleotidyltransferase [Eubacteriales bacterium]
MRVLGIIAEYNPFHNGHLHHLQESIRIANPDFTVCIMSGDFMQRGEPAMADKWIRSSAAIKNGIDLVIELPFVFACNNAEYFAKGAVDILNRLGCITHLSFGSEAGQLSLLNKIADYISNESDQLKAGIKEFADRGYSFPRARYEAVKQCMGKECANTLKSANNILAVEYLKQLNITGSRIEPLTVKRYGTGYLDKECYNNIASASAIREILGKSDNLHEVSDFVPPTTFQVFKELNEGVNVKLNDFYLLLIYQILKSDIAELGNIISATEGLEHRVKKAAISSGDTNSLIRAVLSKRYTQTRIQRLLVHIMLNLDKDSFRNIIEKDINYARVLAISRKGALLLKQIKKENLNMIPILTNINREVSKDSPEWDLLKYDVLASDIYNLIVYGEIYNHSDYIMKPFIAFNSKMDP